MNRDQNRLVIIGALDRTPASDSVENTVTSLGLTLPHAELHFLHVVPQESDLEDAKSFLERVVVEVATRTNGRVAGHVATGAPKREILQYASDLEADLVVVGCHRRGIAGRFLLGSVSQAIVSDAQCAVLVARPKEYSVVPEIEPPCPKCLEVQRSSSGETLWCAAHQTRHARGHLHHTRDAGATGGSSIFIRT